MLCWLSSFHPRPAIAHFGSVLYKDAPLHALSLQFPACLTVVVSGLEVILSLPVSTWFKTLNITWKIYRGNILRPLFINDREESHGLFCFHLIPSSILEEHLFHWLAFLQACRLPSKRYSFSTVEHRCVTSMLNEHLVSMSANKKPHLQ